MSKDRLTKKEVEEVKERVQWVTGSLQKMLRLEHWNITHEVAPESGGGDSAFPPMATCHDNWRYLQLHIVWWGPVVAQRPNAEIARVFVHECLHGLLGILTESKAVPDYIEERVVSEVERAIMSLMQQLRLTPSDEH